MSTAQHGIHIDVVSDVVCPWCFIGKRHLEKALAAWADAFPERPVTVRWHPYFLNPETPEAGEPYRPFLERKFGGPEKLAEIWERVRTAGRSAGIDFAFEKIALRANTLHAHRLIHRAQEAAAGKVDDGGTAADPDGLIEALFAAQFLEGRFVGDRDVLADIAAGCGAERGAVTAYLASDADRAEIGAMAGRARTMGISGVPFFIFNGALAASGAQPPEALLQAMREAPPAKATSAAPPP